MKTEDPRKTHAWFEECVAAGTLRTVRAALERLAASRYPEAELLNEPKSVEAFLQRRSAEGVEPCLGTLPPLELRHAMGRLRNTDPTRDPFVFVDASATLAAEILREAAAGTIGPSQAAFWTLWQHEQAAMRGARFARQEWVLFRLSAEQGYITGDARTIELGSDGLYAATVAEQLAAEMLDARSVHEGPGGQVVVIHMNAPASDLQGIAARAVARSSSKPLDVRLAEALATPTQRHRKLREVLTRLGWSMHQTHSEIGTLWKRVGVDDGGDDETLRTGVRRIYARLGLRSLKRGRPPKMEQ